MAGLIQRKVAVPTPRRFADGITLSDDEWLRVAPLRENLEERRDEAFVGEDERRRLVPTFNLYLTYI